MHNFWIILNVKYNKIIFKSKSLYSEVKKNKMLISFSIQIICIFVEGTILIININGSWLIFLPDLICFENLKQLFNYIALAFNLMQT